MLSLPSTMAGRACILCTGGSDVRTDDHTDRQGKGIGGEFRGECAALIREGLGSKAIIDTLTVKYQKRPHTNPKKVLRFPAEGAIKGLRQSMYNGPGSEIKTNSQLLAWCSGRMCTTKAEFDAL